MKLILQPSMFLVILSAVALVLLFSTGLAKKIGRWLGALALALYILMAFSPLPHVLLLVLENRFPPTNLSSLETPPAGIIVLGGAIDTHVSLGRREVALNEAVERLTVAADLARRFPEAKLLVSGETRTVDDKNYIENMVLISLGVALDRIIYESDSRNTYQNATMGAAVAKPAPGEIWLLVTSASHMPRSVGVFCKAGFRVKPLPVDYRTAGWDDAWLFFDRPSTGLHLMDTAVKEWLGLVAYWLAGWTSALYPGPDLKNCGE
mgnify:CR=1 FL=1